LKKNIHKQEEYIVNYSWKQNIENIIALTYELISLDGKVNIIFPYESIPGAFFFKLSQYPASLDLIASGPISLQKIQIDPTEGSVEKYAWQGIRKDIEGPLPDFKVTDIPLSRSYLIHVFLSLSLILSLGVLYQIVQMIRTQGYKSKDS
jgi:hypothetical protein